MVHLRKTFDCCQKTKEVYTWWPFEEFSDIRVVLFLYSPNLNTFERKNLESIRYVVDVYVSSIFDPFQGLDLWRGCEEVSRVLPNKGPMSGEKGKADS
jgi:hypothetical protein